MSRARHRLSGGKHDDIGRNAIDVTIGTNGTYLYKNVTWYPDEDTTLYNIKGDLGSHAQYTSYGGGGTGSTSATYAIDQYAHHTVQGTSSETYLYLGAANQRVWSAGPAFTWVDYSWFFNPDDSDNDPDDGFTGWLVTPARRIAMTFNTDSWGDCISPVECTNRLGITTGDEVINATMYMHSDQGGGQCGDGQYVQHDVSYPDIYEDITIDVRRICRGACNDGPSAGITAGSMENTGWWSYKGGDRLATAVDAIDTTGYTTSDADASFTISIPTSAGGLGGTAVTILLDEDKDDINQATAAPNTITIGTFDASENDDMVADFIIDVINGVAAGRFIYASEGNGQAGHDLGITAKQGSSGTKITLTMDTGGNSGNISDALASASGVDIVDVTDFTGGHAESASYWGACGGSSGGATSSTYGRNSQDIDRTYGASFTQDAARNAFVPPRTYSIDVTDLVQDAMTSRSGDLRLMFRYMRDIDDTLRLIDPNPGGSAIYRYAYWSNVGRYFSKDHADIALRPRIDIAYRRVIPPA